MLTSTSPISQTLSPTTSIASKTMESSSDVVDISKSRQLLKSTNEFGSVVLTPRKRALARKNNKDKETNGNANTNTNNITSTPSSIGLVSPPLSAHKQVEKSKSLVNLKLDDPVQLKQSNDAQYDPEERITLFQYPKANIYTFEDNTENLDETQKQGRLLGHGKFEVYQMHMKKVSYFQCGSVIYPIFPRLKILKISSNQFILPLSNPERYWKIIIETNDELKVQELEDVFKTICHFRNLYIKPSNTTTTTTKDLTISEPQIPIIPTSKSQISISSITSAVACFALESDSSTFVEQNSTKSTPLASHEQALTEVDDEEQDDVQSIVSSLDSALEDFKESPKPLVFNDQFETTHYYTPRSSARNTTIMEDSRDTIMLSPTAHHHHNHSFQNSSFLKTKTRSSRSASLYISESSWMDPTDEPETSTPGKNERYIKYNLNPNPRFVDKEKGKNHQKRIATDSIMANKSHRFSSYDIYNILRDDSMEIEEDNNNAGFSGFIKSFF